MLANLEAKFNSNTVRQIIFVETISDLSDWNCFKPITTVWLRCCLDVHLGVGVDFTMARFEVAAFLVKQYCDLG